jgi:hypothetical protein
VALISSIMYKHVPFLPTPHSLPNTHTQGAGVIFDSYSVILNQYFSIFRSWHIHKREMFLKYNREDRGRQVLCILTTEKNLWFPLSALGQQIGCLAIFLLKNSSL